MSLSDNQHISEREEKLSSEERKLVLDKKVVKGGFHLKLEDYEDLLDDQDFLTLSKLDFDEIHLGFGNPYREAETNKYLTTYMKFCPVLRWISLEVFLKDEDGIAVVTGVDLESLQAYAKSKNLPVTVDSAESEQSEARILVTTENPSEAYSKICSKFESSNRKIYFLHAYKDLEDQLQFDCVASQRPHRFMEAFMNPFKIIGTEELLTGFGSGEDNLWHRISYHEDAVISTECVERIGGELEQLYPTSWVLSTTPSKILAGMPALASTLRETILSTSEYQHQLNHDKYLNEFISNFNLASSTSKHLSASSVLAKNMLVKRTSAGRPNVELFVTGWEDLPSENTDICIKVFSYLRRYWKGIRFTLFLPLVNTFQDKLLQALGPNLWYLIEQLNFEDQVNTIEQYCEEKGKSKAVSKVAQVCLTLLGEAIEDRVKFTSLIPILVEVVELADKLVRGEEEIYNKFLEDEEEEKLKEILPRGIIIFAKVCESFVAKTIVEKLSSLNEDGTRELSQKLPRVLEENEPSLNARMLAEHNFEIYAVAKVFMDKGFEYAIPDTWKYDRDVLRQFKIITAFTQREESEEVVATFIRPEFQEYFCWKVHRSGGMLRTRQVFAFVESVCEGEGLEALKHLVQMEQRVWQKEALLKCVSGDVASLKSFQFMLEMFQPQHPEGSGEYQVLEMAANRGHVSIVKFLRERAKVDIKSNKPKREKKKSDTNEEIAKKNNKGKWYQRFC